MRQQQVVTLNIKLLIKNPSYGTKIFWHLATYVLLQSKEKNMLEERRQSLAQNKNDNMNFAADIFLGIVSRKQSQMKTSINQIKYQKDVEQILFYQSLLIVGHLNKYYSHSRLKFAHRSVREKFTQLQEFEEFQVQVVDYALILNYDLSRIN